MFDRLPILLKQRIKGRVTGQALIPNPKVHADPSTSPAVAPLHLGCHARELAWAMFKNNLGSGNDMAMGKEIGTDQPDSRASAEIPLDELIESTMPIDVDRSMSSRKAGGSSDYGMPSHTDGMAVPIDELIKKTKPE